MAVQMADCSVDTRAATMAVPTDVHWAEWKVVRKAGLLVARKAASMVGHLGMTWVACSAELWAALLVDWSVVQMAASKVEGRAVLMAELTAARKVVSKAANWVSK
jgi:hypothetical protein